MIMLASTLRLWLHTFFHLSMNIFLSDILLIFIWWELETKKTNNVAYDKKSREMIQVFKKLKYLSRWTVR